MVHRTTSPTPIPKAIILNGSDENSQAGLKHKINEFLERFPVPARPQLIESFIQHIRVVDAQKNHSSNLGFNNDELSTQCPQFTEFLNNNSQAFTTIITHTGFLGRHGWNNSLTRSAQELMGYLNGLMETATAEANGLSSRLNESNDDQQTIITFMTAVLPINTNIEEISTLVNSMQPAQIMHIATVARDGAFFDNAARNSALLQSLTPQLNLATDQVTEQKPTPPLIRFFMHSLFMHSLQFGMGTTEQNREKLQRFIDDNTMTQNKAATNIQRVFRGHSTRKNQAAKNQAATNIQRVFRGHSTRKNQAAKNKAATNIQRVFRDHFTRTTTLEYLIQHPAQIDKISNHTFEGLRTKLIIHAISNNDHNLMNILRQKLDKKQEHFEEKKDDDLQPYPNDPFIDAVVDLILQGNTEISNALDRNNNHELRSYVVFNYLSRIGDSQQPDSELFQLIVDEIKRDSRYILDGLLECNNTKLKLQVVESLLEGEIPQHIANNRKLQIFITEILSGEAEENKINEMMKHKVRNIPNDNQREIMQNQLKVQISKTVKKSYESIKEVLTEALSIPENSQFRIDILGLIINQASELVSTSVEQSEQQDRLLQNKFNCITKLLQSQSDIDFESKSDDEVGQWPESTTRVSTFVNSLKPILVTCHQKQIVTWMQILGDLFILKLSPEIVGNLGISLIELLIKPGLPKNTENLIHSKFDFSGREETDGIAYNTAPLVNKVIRELLENETRLGEVINFLVKERLLLDPYFKEVETDFGTYGKMKYSVLSTPQILQTIFKKTTSEDKEMILTGKLNSDITFLVKNYPSSSLLVSSIFDELKPEELIKWANNMTDDLLRTFVSYYNYGLFFTLSNADTEIFEKYTLLLIEQIYEKHKTPETEVTGICKKVTFNHKKIAIALTKALATLEPPIGDNLLRQLLKLNQQIVNSLREADITTDLSNKIIMDRRDDYITFITPKIFGIVLKQYLTNNTRCEDLKDMFKKICDANRTDLIGYLESNQNLIKVIIATMGENEFIKVALNVQYRLLINLIMYADFDLVQTEIKEKYKTYPNNIFQSLLSIKDLNLIKKVLSGIRKDFNDKECQDMVDNLIYYIKASGKINLYPEILDKSLYATWTEYLRKEHNINTLIPHIDQENFKFLLKILWDTSNLNELIKHSNYVLNCIIKENRFDLITHLGKKELRLLSPFIVTRFGTTDGLQISQNKSNELKNHEEKNQLQKSYDENGHIKPYLSDMDGSILVLTENGGILFSTFYKQIFIGGKVDTATGMAALASPPTLVEVENDGESKDYGSETKNDDDNATLKLNYTKLRHNDERIPKMLREEIRKCVIPVDIRIENMFKKFDELVPEQYHLSEEQKRIMQECLSNKPDDIRSTTPEERWKLFCNDDAQIKLSTYFNAVTSLNNDVLIGHLCAAFNVGEDDKDRLLFVLSLLFIRLSSKSNLGIEDDTRNYSAVGPRCFGGHLLEMFAARKYTNDNTNDTVPPRLQTNINEITEDKCSWVIANSLGNMLRDNVFQFTDTSTFGLNIDCS